MKRRFYVKRWECTRHYEVVDRNGELLFVRQCYRATRWIAAALNAHAEREKARKK